MTQPALVNPDETDTVKRMETKSTEDWLDGDFKVFVLVESYVTPLYPSRDVDLLHLSINYLRNIGVKQEDIVIVGDEPQALAYGEQYGMKTYNTLEYDRTKRNLEPMERAYAKHGEGKNLILLASSSICPYREHNFLRQFQNEVLANPDSQCVSFVMDPYRKKDTYTGVMGFNKKMLKEYSLDNLLMGIIPERNVYHNLFCSYRIITPDQLGNEDVIRAMTNHAYNLNIYESPVPSNYSYSIPL
jgi:hypothetical protein